MSCTFRNCGDPCCQVCTTTARGFPQPPTLDEQRLRKQSTEHIGKAHVGTKPGRATKARKAAA